MKYLLDTNTCIRFINGRAPKIRERFLLVSEDEIVISSISKAEMYYGSAKSQTPEISRAKQDSFFNRFTSISFSDQAAEFYGTIRAGLERKGKPIGQNDMLIAAIALANNLVLVTHNISEFERVPNLTLEDWEV